MIFTLVSVAQEWVNERNDLARIKKVEREERKKMEEEEAERVCLRFILPFLKFCLIKLKNPQNLHMYVEFQHDH